MAGTDRSWLFVVRFGQFTAAFCYLVGALTAHATKGWWVTIQPAFTFGMVSAALTLAFFLPFFWTIWIKSGPREIAGGSLLAVYASFAAAVLRDSIMCALWIATFATMCLPKGKNYAHLFDTPPYPAWVFSILCAAFEIVTYAGSTYHLFWLYERATPNRVPIQTV